MSYANRGPERQASMSLPAQCGTCAALAVCVLLVAFFPVAAFAQQSARGQGTLLGTVGGAVLGAVGGWLIDALTRNREVVYLAPAPQ